jgi:hypothetical protein
MLAVLPISISETVDAEKVPDPLANLRVAAIDLLVRAQSKARKCLPLTQWGVGLVHELRHGWQKPERA